MVELVQAVLDGSLREHEPLGDRGIGVALRDQVEDLALALREPRERPFVGAPARHEVRVEHHQPGGGALERPRQRGHVRDGLLQQVAPPRHRVGRQRREEPRHRVVREQHDPDLGQLLAQEHPELDAAGPRAEIDVEHRDVRPQRGQPSRAPSRRRRPRRRPRSADCRTARAATGRGRARRPRRSRPGALQPVRPPGHHRAARRRSDKSGTIPCDRVETLWCERWPARYHLVASATRIDSGGNHHARQAPRSHRARAPRSSAGGSAAGSSSALRSSPPAGTSRRRLGLPAGPDPVGRRRAWIRASPPTGPAPAKRRRRRSTSRRSRTGSRAGSTATGRLHLRDRAQRRRRLQRRQRLPAARRRRQAAALHQGHDGADRERREDGHGGSIDQGPGRGGSRSTRRSARTCPTAGRRGRTSRTSRSATSSATTPSSRTERVATPIP